MEIKLKSRFVLLLILLLSNKIGTAQTASVKKFAVTTQPLQFLFRDIPVNFERIYNRQTLGFTIGYRFDASSKSSSYPMTIFTGSNLGFTASRFKALTLGVNSKYFLDNKTSIYIEGQLFFRYWWHNKSFYGNYYDGDSSPDKEYNASARNQVLGTKFLFGTRINSSKTTRIQPIMNCYIGLGCRVQFIHEYGVSRLVYNSSPGPFNAFDDKSIIILPTVHFGFNVGLSILTKTKRSGQ